MSELNPSLFANGFIAELAELVAGRSSARTESEALALLQVDVDRLISDAKLMGDETRSNLYSNTNSHDRAYATGAAQLDQLRQAIADRFE